MGNAIRIRDDGSDDEFGREFQRLAGIPWPPADQSAWLSVLLRAGFSTAQVQEFFATIGEPGYSREESRLLQRGIWSLPGRPPAGWVSFSAILLQGLRTANERSPLPDVRSRAWAVYADMKRESLQKTLLAMLLDAGERPVHIDEVAEKLYGGDPVQFGEPLRKVLERLNKQLFPHVEVRKNAAGFYSLDSVGPPGVLDS